MKQLLTIEELIEEGGVTILLGVAKDELKILKDGDVVVYSGKLSINGVPVTIKLVPNKQLEKRAGKNSAIRIGTKMEVNLHG